MSEDAILKAICTYRYLTIDQVMLLLQRSSLRHTQMRLKQLKDAGYVERIARHTTNRGGSLKPAYTLTKKATRYLEQQGMLVPAPHVPKPYFLNHTLALNSVLIAGALLAERYSPQVKLLRVIHEQELKRWSLPNAVPDGYLQFRVLTGSGWHEYPILIELDMGTEDQAAWHRKLERYARFFPDTLREHFHIKSATLAVITTAEPPRADNLTRWTEQSLTRLNREGLAGFLLFGHSVPTMTPEELYLSARFRVPFDTANTHRLIEEQLAETASARPA